MCESMSFVKILLKHTELTTKEIKIKKQPSNKNCCVNL